MKTIIEKSLSNSITYKTYRHLISNLLTESKSTGHKQSESLTNYSLLNDRRMKRLDKTIKLSNKTVNEIKAIKEHQTWLVLTEGWCGDAAQNLPVINKISEENNLINFKLVLRDDNEKLMNIFLTNGGKSIPKLIILDKENNIINTWGPRPSIATKMVEDYKNKYGKLDAQFKQNLQVWYNKNKGQNLQEDLIRLTK